MPFYGQHHISYSLREEMSRGSLPLWLCSICLAAFLILIPLTAQMEHRRMIRQNWIKGILSIFWKLRSKPLPFTVGSRWGITLTSLTPPVSMIVRSAWEPRLTWSGGGKQSFYLSRIGLNFGSSVARCFLNDRMVSSSVRHLIMNAFVLTSDPWNIRDWSH